MITAIWAIAITLWAIREIMLFFSKVVNFLRSRAYLKQADHNNVAFSLQKKLNTGDYQTVYGIFNQRSGDLNAEKVESQSIDGDLGRYHAGREMVVYN